MEQAEHGLGKQVLLSSLKGSQVGRAAAVLGGGPSGPEDLKKAWAFEPVLIAVNYHAFDYCEPDYMVYNDEPETDPALMKAVKTARVVKVSPEPTSDVLFDVPVWTGFFSSNTATWFALYLGCAPVLLCGMDCYQGEVKYLHDYEDKPILHFPLDFYLRPWREDAPNLLPHPERVLAVSGPLTEVFGRL